MILNKFENIINMDQWSEKDLEQAMEYYKKELTHTREDNERIWYVDTISRCQIRLDEIQGTTPEWLKMFS